MLGSLVTVWSWCVVKKIYKIPKKFAKKSFVKKKCFSYRTQSTVIESSNSHSNASVRFVFYFNYLIAVQQKDRHVGFEKVKSRMNVVNKSVPVEPIKHHR